MSGGEKTEYPGTEIESYPGAGPRPEPEPSPYPDGDDGVSGD